MTDLGALLKRETTADRIVGDLVTGARGDVASVLGLVVARTRAVLVGDEVKGAIRDKDQVVKALSKEREALRPEVVKLEDQVIRARADLEVARRQKQRAFAAGDRGEAPDVAAVEDRVKTLEGEREGKRVRLRTVTSKGREAERDKATLAELLTRLESLPVGDPDVLAVLGGVLANGGKYSKPR